MFRRLLCSKLCALLAVAATGCASRPEIKSKIPALTQMTDEEVLMDDGDCSQPSFSPSGDRLLYICQGRATHAQAQIYERQLGSGEERRLTFQNGSTFSPRYHPKEPWIVYASTTDELKENPPLLNPQSEPSPLPPDLQKPTEIYIHSLDGLEITRVTDRFGYDGEPRFSPDGRQLIWTRVEKNRTQVIVLNRNSQQISALRRLGSNPAEYILSGDKKWSAWLDWDNTFGTVKLLLRKGNAAPVELNSEHVVVKENLIFSPDSRFLAWSQLNALNQHRELWVHNLENNCSYMLVGSDSADRRHPAFSPDMKTVAYTVTRSERSRIAAMPFVPPTGPCSAGD